MDQFSNLFGLIWVKSCVYFFAFEFNRADDLTLLRQVFNFIICDSHRLSHIISAMFKSIWGGGHRAYHLLRYILKKIWLDPLNSTIEKIWPSHCWIFKTHLPHEMMIHQMEKSDHFLAQAQCSNHPLRYEQGQRAQRGSLPSY